MSFFVYVISKPISSEIANILIFHFLPFITKGLHLFQMDQDLWSKALSFHGSLLLQTIIGEVPEPKSDAEKDKQVMCKFISKRKNMLFKFSDQPPGDLPEHTIPIVPIEIFRDVSPDERRDLFYKSLDRGHILVLRVINDTLPDNYKLLVLCKQENHMKLDDLSIIMFLPKLPAELELAGGKLESNDLIRAAVCSCSIDERKLYVTLDSNILEDEAENVYLGKITEKDLPFYVGDVDLGPSYVDFLNNTTTFYNPNWSEDLHRILNLKNKYLYSFMDGLDGKTYDRSVYASELRKKQILSVSDAHYNTALQHYKTGNFTEAFLYFNKALSVNPKHVEALVSRGTLYANTNNVNKAFKDIEAALNIDPKHEKASKQMSVLLVSVAKTHIEANNLDKAEKSLEAALYVDNYNKDAIAVYEELKKLINEKMDTDDKSSDKSVKTSGSGKKDRIGSCSSDRSDSSSSKKDDSKEDSKGLNQGFNLEAATKKFLDSMQKKRQDSEKDKKGHHRTHHTSQSKSPKSNASP